MLYLMLAALIVAAAIYYYIKSIHYWERQGVLQASVKFHVLEVINFVFKKRSVPESIEVVYNMFSENRYSGFYSIIIPVLMIKDPDLLKDVTVKNFDHFTDHFNIIPEGVEPLWARNLFTLKGQKWRDMRPILSPAFTSSKMKTIFLLISECAQNLSHHYLKKGEQIVEVELKDSFTRFTNDVIATVSFGIKIDSLENQDNQFYEMGKKLTNFNNIFSGFKLLVLILSPKLFTLLKLSIFDKEVIRYFKDLIENTLTIRKQNGILRPDMIQLLLEAQKGIENKEAEVEDNSFAAQSEADLGKGVQRELTNTDIAAQALIFFFAGFETISTLMCFMGYELAVHPDIQQRLREEIEETFENCQGNVSYEAIMKMKYIDMVVSESLRKWPSMPAVDRQCTKDYTIEPKLPGERPVYIKPKDFIWIPIYAIHRDPNIYPEPNKFDPERFNDENKGNINPYTYIPFGLGPRNCIGSRFALLEIKTVFFYLLKNFELVPTKRSRIPIKLLPSSFSMTAEGGFWFGLKKLNK